MKITKTTERVKGRGEVTTFFVDEIKVATCRKFQEWFCTVRNGAPSNIRDRTKTAKETSWNREGLSSVLKTNDFKIGYSSKPGDFNDDYPDTTWGYAGSLLTGAKIKKLITEFQEKTK